MYQLLGFICLISVVHGQIQLSGNCSTDLQYQKDFNVTEFTGQWYEYERIQNTYESGACSSVTFTQVLFQTKPIFFVSNQEVADEKLLIRTGIILGMTNYQFSVVYSDGVMYDFVVLKTNLKDYAIIYSCQNNANGKAVLAWKLSRTQTPSSKSIAEFNVVKNYTDIANATWIAPSHTKDACKTRNGATNLGLSSTLLVLFGLYVSKNV